MFHLPTNGPVETTASGASGSMRGVCGENDAGAVGEWNVPHRVTEEDDLAHSQNLSVVYIAKRNPELVIHFGGGEGEVGGRKGVKYS